MKTNYKGYVLDSTDHGVDIFRGGVYVHTEESDEGGLMEANWIRRGEEWVDENHPEFNEYSYFEFMDRADGAMDALNRLYRHPVTLAHPEAAAAFDAANDAVYKLYQLAGELFAKFTEDQERD